MAKYMEGPFVEESLMKKVDKTDPKNTYKTWSENLL